VRKYVEETSYKNLPLILLQHQSQLRFIAMKNLKIVIVGAGMGGLEAALALAADGHGVTVLEGAEKFEEVRCLQIQLVADGSHNTERIGRGRNQSTAEFITLDAPMGRGLF
jgi:monoamine oxidase